MEPVHVNADCFVVKTCSAIFIKAISEDAGQIKLDKISALFKSLFMFIERQKRVLTLTISANFCIIYNSFQKNLKAS